MLEEEAYMIDRIVFDVEIQKTIEETPGGWDSTHLLGVAVCVVYEYRSDRFRIYGPQDVEALRGRVLKAEELIGFNTLLFDIPVIFGMSKEEYARSTLRSEMLLKSNDILRRIWVSQGLNPDRFQGSTHGGWKLDDVVKSTLGASGKIGNGADAPKWFQAGEWARVVNYCADDVSLEKDLAEFVDRYSYVIAPRTQRKLVVPHSTKYV